MFHSVYVEVFVSVSFCCECMCVCDESALKIKRQEAACKKQTPRKIKKECAQTTEVEEKKVFLICFPLYFQYDYNYLW